MSYDSPIFRRRSVRKYNGESISEDDLKYMLEAGMVAPTSKNKQPGEFIVLNHDKTIEQLTTIPQMSLIKQAGQAIVVCGDRSKNDEIKVVQDLSAASLNIMLAATELDLKTVWLAVYPNEKRIENIREVCKLPNNVFPLAIIVVGKSDEKIGHIDRYDHKKVHFNQF